MKQGEKWIWIVTGPNGSGKTHGHDLLPPEAQALPYINHDAVATELAKQPEYADDPSYEGPWPSPQVTKRYMEAYAQNEQVVSDHMAKGESFAVEMTYPSSVLGKKINDLQNQGWKIGVLAVGIKDYRLAQQRIIQRVEEGGHFVAGSQEAWEQCQKMTPALLKNADRFMLYDNSGDKHLLVATKYGRDSEVAIHNKPPNNYAEIVRLGAESKNPKINWNR